jgi:tRNA nucleotidyltransferase (CCA-adding enzyme)
MAPRTDPPFPVDPAAIEVLRTLWERGNAAYLVGGGVRDGLLGRSTNNWDLSTDARPEELLTLFPGGTYQNRFGTVLVPGGVEVTTFREDHRYGDHRRPDEVTFTDDPLADLARRDFTVNAIAWGRGKTDAQPDFLDPTGGRADLDARLLRAVGNPDRRFDEDALRMLRAARLAAQVGLEIEAETLGAIGRHAADVRFVSGERVGTEVRRILESATPSTGLRVLQQTGLLAALVPQLAAQRGVPQAKIPGHDLWDHTLLTVDAAANLRPHDLRLTLAALLHDSGKPETFAAGHFIGHAAAGAAIAREWLGRIAYPSRDADFVARLIEEHMFEYSPTWSDAAVRRFMKRVGVDLVDDLLVLRQADNVGSGHTADAGHLAELRERVETERTRRSPMSVADLAVNGNDILAALGREAGPWLGQVLARLLDSVIGDPTRNTPSRLLADVREWSRRGQLEPSAKSNVAGDVGEPT